MVIGGRGAQVLLGLEGGGGEDDGREAPAMFFFDTSCVPEHTSLQRKKTQAKIARCSGMSKFCPPAAASRESMRGIRDERTRCAANGGWGGGGTRQNWQGSAPQQTSLAQTWFLVFGLCF